MANDGGPAFPQNDATVNRINNHDGMSLRDYFAAKAMQALIQPALSSVEPYKRGEVMHISCGAAYEIADAMLAARGQA